MANSAVVHAGSGGGRGGLTKKLLLWLLLVVQLCFIFCFWCLQTGFQEHGTADATINGKRNFPEPKSAMGITQKEKSAYAEPRVHFITRKKILTATERLSDSMKQHNALRNMNNFTKDFFQLKPYRLMNITGMEAEMGNDVIDANSLAKNIVWCFREGTNNETTRNADLENHNLQNFWDVGDPQQPQCTCKQHWHGADCGQPEIMWRALLLARGTLKLQEPNEKLPPNRLVYMLEGTFQSLDLLELQIKAVDDVVDYFLIYWTAKQTKLKAYKALEHRLRELLSDKRYMLFNCRLIYKRNNCNATEAFTYFKNQMSKTFSEPMQPTDLMVYTNEHIVLERQALQFLKYYASRTMPIWRFRLKHTVYGFYWQHPQRTHLSGLICSFSHLNSDTYDNPHNLQRLLVTENWNGIESINIIGDLNHYGGWFCEYCEEPDEIIAELQESYSITGTSEQKEQLRKNNVQFPNITRNRHIDANYLQHLIAEGIYIDGKTQLEKQRRYTDKHFAPNYAEDYSWKFGNLLTNLFEALNEDDDFLEEAKEALRK